MEAVIFWLSVALAAYWSLMWLRNRHMSLGHDAQIVCAVMLWAVVAYFALSPDTSKMNMLWAVPVAFFSSSFVSAPYIRLRAKLLGIKHPLE